MEMREAWNARQALPHAAVAQLQATIGLMDECSATTRPFARTPLSPQANFFACHAHRAPKSLLVCFCGVANRMMMPVPVFLQLVPEDRFDVLVLKDPAGLGYLRGVPGLGGDLRQVAQAIASRLDCGSYADVRCLGVSGGGAAALYAGLLLQAERAVSVCGSHRSLASGPRGAGPAAGPTGHEFDALTAGRAGNGATRLVAVFGAQSARDREGAASLKEYLPACEMMAVANLADHNVLAGLLKNGALKAFLAEVLFSGGGGMQAGAR